MIYITYKEVKNYIYETWKNAGASLIRIMNQLHISDIEVDMAELFAEIGSQESYIQFCLGMFLASYSFDYYFGEKRLKEKNNILPRKMMLSERSEFISFPGCFLYYFVLIVLLNF